MAFQIAQTLAFIGGGNMATSLIGGLIAAGTDPQLVRVAEPDAARAAALRERFGVSIAAAGAEIVAGAAAVVLAVKPQQLVQAVKPLRLDAGATVLSIAAGVRVATLRAALGDGVHLVRSMPNTPALYGCGISGLYAPAGTPPSARDLAQTILDAAGQTCWVEQESDLDAVTAVSGSGPAYFFLLVEAMREAGEQLGLSPAVAAQLAARTLVGAAKMVDAGDTDVAVLREQVTSRGGTTEAALRHLESAGLRPMFAAALAAAARRSSQLGDELAAAKT
ncbi:pyrroline-5-carboxylate reductase [Hydrocarboniphaga sp.]|uniref:pyrroline-5-carboxylate reductase n=1 Tax=Hydrocarboniphaga sp. TaxID=2033016 RepID=UPI0026109EA1|nr:pyrroline-5-carboxylate reductase [Hydrocarboniphaga sp.]